MKEIVNDKNVLEANVLKLIMDFEGKHPTANITDMRLLKLDGNVIGERQKSIHVKITISI